MKKINFIFFIVCLASSLPFFSWADFDDDMGKGSSRWHYVQTPEDRSELCFYRELYEKNNGGAPLHSIPKVIHFIWLGPQDFPAESVKNIKAWIHLHPDWIVKFWSDIDREPPIQTMQRQRIASFSFKTIGDLYYKSENFREKAHLLAYEILWQEGGLYLDHDVKPLGSFDNLQVTSDFYCGLETLGPSIMSSCIFPSAHLIAAKPHHPILSSAIDWISSHWDLLEEQYPGTDLDALRNRVYHRSLFALHRGIKSSAGIQGNKDIVFPSAAFSEEKPTKQSLATHAHAATWLERSSDDQKKMIRRLHELEQTSKTMLLSLVGLGGLNVGIALFLFSKIIKKKNKSWVTEEV